MIVSILNEYKKDTSLTNKTIVFNFAISCPGCPRFSEFHYIEPFHLPPLGNRGYPTWFLVMSSLTNFRNIIFVSTIEFLPRPFLLSRFLINERNINWCPTKRSTGLV